MAANMGRPKPVDRIGWRRDLVLHVRCPCGRKVDVYVGPMAELHGLPMNGTIYEMLRRMRCMVCGHRPPEVTGYLGGYP